MRWRHWLSAALVCVGLAPVWGQVGPGVPAAGVGTVRTLSWRTVDNERGTTAGYRGRIVVVFFFRPGTAEGDRVLDAVRSVVGSMEGLGIAAAGVAVSDQPEVVRGALDRRRVTYPVHFDERTGGLQVARQWGLPEGNGIVLLDPRQRVAAVGVPVAILEDVLRRQVELTPPEIVAGAVLAAAERQMVLAEAMFNLGRPRSAARYLSSLPAEVLADKAMAERRGKLTLQLEGSVPGLIEETERLFEQEKMSEAVLMLEQLVGALGEGSAREAAAEQLYSFLDDPDLREAVEAGRAEAVASDLVASAGELMELLDEGGAYAVYRRVMEEYAGTEAAKEAASRVAAMERNPEDRRRLRDAFAGNAPTIQLNTARSYRASGLTEKARELYRKVIEDHPGTSAAEVAAKELAELR